MRVDGSWLLSDDGAIRPVAPGLVRLSNDQWLEVSFLLDAGADRTVFSTRFYPTQVIALLASPHSYEIKSE